MQKRHHLATDFLDGFSFVEIILVVVILAIIAGLAIPNFSQTYLSFQLKRTAEDMAFLLRYAQSRAVTKNRYVQLQYDADRSQYWLEEASLSPVLNSLQEDFERFSGRWGRTFDVLSDIDLELSQDHIRFYPDGSIDKAQFYICQKKKCFTISTKLQRGAVHVFDGRLE